MVVEGNTTRDGVSPTNYGSTDVLDMATVVVDTALLASMSDKDIFCS